MESSQNDHDMESVKKNPKFDKKAFKIVNEGESSDEESKKPDHQPKQATQKMNAIKQVLNQDELMELESLDIASSVAASERITKK